MIRVEFKNHAPSLEVKERMKAAIASLRRRPEAAFLHVLQAREDWEQSSARAMEIRHQANRLVVVGTGGSSLGTRALAALCPDAKIDFLEHTDPQSVSQFKKSLARPGELHWLWVSKSGNTLETLGNLGWVEQWYKDQGFNLARFSTVVAGPHAGPLQDWAKQNEVPHLKVPPMVGGRYSVLTPVGLLPAAWMGLDLEELQAGVEWALKQDDLVAEVAAASLASWQREEWITLLWTYADQLQPFGRWLQQLWAESLAKAKTRDGRPPQRVSFPVPCIGAVDQHSLLQQVMEGARDKWVWLSRVESFEQEGEQVPGTNATIPGYIHHRTMGQIFNAQAKATGQAMASSGIATMEWVWTRVDARHLGAAFMLMEMLVASLGEAIEINPFDQPGVELGKVLTQDLLGR